MASIWARQDTPPPPNIFEQQQLQQPGGAMPAMDDGFGGLNLPMMAQQSAELVRWQLELNDVCDDIEHFLRGDVLVNGEWAPERAARLMSEEGIKSFLTILRGRLHKGIILSNFSEKEILPIMYRIAKEVTNFIYLKHDAYNIAFEHFDTIKNVICLNIHATLKRAQEAGERNFLSRTQRRIEQVTQFGGMNEQKKGLINKIFGGFIK
jgi:hypothetical protein